MDSPIYQPSSVESSELLGSDGIPEHDSQRDGSIINISSATWPANRIPHEIHNLIADYLERSDIQNMRLVNREFDHNLSSRYFNNVVVTFRPEFSALYGSLDTSLGVMIDSQQPDLTAQVDHSSTESSLQDGSDGSSSSSRRSSSSKTSELSTTRKSVMSDGFRVFQQFGPVTIKKFALALELNELDLAYPPVKLSQEIVKAPWGLYRWPIKEYPRYSKLEGLERLADETQYMKEAFRWLTSVNEIGISCDPGLGYLRGPDKNRLYHPISLAVFKPTNYHQEEKDRRGSAEEADGRSMSLVILKQMALNAGYDDNDWHWAVLRLLEDEGRNVRWVEQRNANGDKITTAVPRYPVDQNTTKQDILNILESLINVTDANPVKEIVESPVVNEETPSVLPRRWLIRRLSQPIPLLVPLSVPDIPTTKTVGLVPASLTSAQAEMLLELDWAHRALMQSYVIAVMDNKDVMRNLTTLTVARISGSHIEFLCKDEFWDALTSVTNFSLGVIPEWRSISKSDTGIEQNRENPMGTYEHAFKLLHDYVGKRDNIKSLHFEWLCGGEFALGISQRDRYILPAPVVQNYMHHVLDTWDQNMISLPHVTHLSLKNCWVPPHVLLHTVQSLSEQSLTHLELESVSLIGCPSRTPEVSIMPSGNASKPAHWPWPLCCGAEPGQFFLLQRPGHAGIMPGAAAALQQQLPNLPWGPGQGGALPQGFVAAHNGMLQNALHMMAPAHNAGPLPLAVNLPGMPPMANPAVGGICRWRPFSWPHVLASLSLNPEAVQDYYTTCTPEDHGHYRAMMELEQSFVPQLPRTKNQLQSVSFKSCGYALVDHPMVNNWDMIPSEFLHVAHRNELPRELKDLDQSMLTSAHPMLAKTLNYISDEEQHILRSLHGLSFGWQHIYDEVLVDIAKADGNPDPGACRFYGEITRDKTAPVAELMPVT